MLERDVRQHLHGGAKDVGRVVPSAETRLDDCDVDLGGREGSERSSGQELELGRADVLGRRSHSLDRSVEIRLVAPHADPLAPALHVGREVGADDETGLREQLLDRARDGRLAVRPDDVNGRVAQLRIAESREQRLDPVEPEAVLRPGTERLDVLTR